MKKQKRHIRFAWIILICFIAGQAVMYSHRHFVDFKIIKTQAVKGQHLQTVTEKCNICDAMHHNHMALFTNAAIYPPVSVCNALYTRQHDYTGFALILSAGRSPPVA